MLHKTKGVVLGSINYNDKYILVQIYTEAFGRVTYMVSKTKSKNTKVPKALFASLFVLELEVDHQASRDIQRIREARAIRQLYTISNDLKKTSMVFFLSEFLTRVLKDANDSKLVYYFLDQSIFILEETDNSIANYHLVFMLKLTRFLGFHPNLEEYSRNKFFDMINGDFVVVPPLHKHYLGKEESYTMSLFARITYDNMHHFKFSRNDRTNIINRILEYYRLHLYDFPELKSLEVLHQLF